MTIASENQSQLSLEALDEGIFRISIFPSGSLPGSALNRYGFLREEWEKVEVVERKTRRAAVVQTSIASLRFSESNEPWFELRGAKESFLLRGQVERFSQRGFRLGVELEEGERLYGFGDQTRDRIEQRGSRADMWVLNVARYIPIPFIMSSRGYGLFVNTTHRHGWDIGATGPDGLRVYVPEDRLDFYLICGQDLKEILTSYTEITGKPALPPKWSFGLWFICRTQANDFEVVSDALNFRDRKIPCDVIGLEPGWMEKNYDYSVDKQWNSVRFPIPSYAWTGPHNFFNCLKRMGYRLELWLCNDYDLSYEAERQVGHDLVAEGAAAARFWDDDVEKDMHFTHPVKADKLTKPEEAWFEHLKKFVDQGVDFFKQDGASQVCEHPDRLWANGMRDEEMHNLYPLLYSQQMFEGFKAYTGRRPCGFTPAGWAGLQRYTGTWTGDTGGGPKTLVACLNLALSGHSLVTCDMEVTTKEGIHYGFLMPWAQVNSWNYFRHPWLQGDELYAVFCDYARLRSQLIPYLYTYAHVAHTTGIPMMRPMPLEFPDDPKRADLLTQYCLGEELLVTVFTDTAYLPEGKWIDYWTGERHSGPREFRYSPPANRGGGLFVRANSILPLGPVTNHVGQPTAEGFTLRIFFGAGGSAQFELYEDDGVTFDYEKGEFSLHRFRATHRRGSLAIDAPEGIRLDKIEAWLNPMPQQVLLNGGKVVGEWDEKTGRLTIAVDDAV